MGKDSDGFGWMALVAIVSSLVIYGCGLWYIVKGG